MSGGMQCPDCGRDHADWSDAGSYVVNGPHHEGIIDRYECGHCGNVVEGGRR